MATNGIQGGNIVIGMRELLEEMVARSASDLHITAGLSPQYRIDGSIVPTQFPALAGDDTRRLAYSILNDEQKKRFENEHELDFSFGVTGLSRFRANVFQQRGVTAMAIRQIPYQIHSFEQRCSLLWTSCLTGPMEGHVVETDQHLVGAERAVGLRELHD